MQKVRVIIVLFFCALGAFGQEIKTTKGKIEKIHGVEFQHYVSKANGVNIHYVKGGQGTPVILVHGWPQTWKEWYNQMPVISKTNTVIALDLRGAGESDKPEMGYTKKIMATDIFELIKILGYDKVTIIGHDIGGMVAYSFANLFPEKTMAMGIGDVPVPGFEPFWSYVTNDPRAWHFAFHAVPEVPELMVKGREKEYIKHFMLSMMGNKEAFEEKDFDYYANWLKNSGNLRGGFEYYRAFKQDAEDNKQFFGTKIKVPVFAFGGQYSMGENQGVLMQNLAENVTTVNILNAGHWVTEENPKQLNAALIEFLSKL